MTLDMASGLEVGFMFRRLFVRGTITLVLTIAALLLMSMPAHAFTEMTDDELSQVTGAGFSSFSLENDVAKAYFNIEAKTFTEIASVKMGYYDNGSGFGWDQDWVNVSLGSATEDLVCKGFYIEAKFTNLSDPATRSLDYIKIGTPSMTGPITATFNSFSGRIENPGGVLVDGQRLNLGRNTIYSTNSEFYLQLSKSGTQAGWWAYWNNATITPVP
jgi:hypothetical protein